MKTIDDVLNEVALRASGRTRYFDQPPFADEMMAAEIVRLRKELADAKESVRVLATELARRVVLKGATTSAAGTPAPPMSTSPPRGWEPPAPLPL